MCWRSSRVGHDSACFDPYWELSVYLTRPHFSREGYATSLSKLALATSNDVARASFSLLKGLRVSEYIFMYLDIFPCIACIECCVVIPICCHV